MKRLTCEMCGGTDLIKQDGVFVCQNCGMKYSVEDAKKMMIEGTVDVKGTVQVDNSAFVQKYLTNANRALEKEDWEEVEKYYNMVEQNSPQNMEAVFFSSYGKAMLSLTDADYFKREQKFKVLNRSMSVISDYYETTTENKEEVLRKISRYIKKMYEFSFVYDKPTNLNGVFNSLSGITGSETWCAKLFDSTKEAFVTELRQISEKHDDAYLQELINELGGAKGYVNEKQLSKEALKDMYNKEAVETDYWEEAKPKLLVSAILSVIPFIGIASLIYFIICNWNLAKSIREDGNTGLLKKMWKYYIILYFCFIIGVALTISICSVLL